MLYSKTTNGFYLHAVHGEDIPGDAVEVSADMYAQLMRAHERAGNDALAAEADTLAMQLLDITADHDLNVATTYEAMQTAGVAAYKRIAGAASPELAVVFREITGA